MSPSLARQEFYCDPEAATEGAIYSRQHTLLMAREPIIYKADSRIVRIAWGMHEEAICAVAFQDNRVIGVHPFLEINLTDCVQAVIRRHPNAPVIHHAINPDTALFSSLDGYGVVSAPVSPNPHMLSGNVAAMLNICEATGTAREQLADFAMLYAPYRDENDQENFLAYPAIEEAVAVMQSAQVLSQTRTRKPLRYASDRGVI
jgi:hypothetical protein